MDTWSVAAAAQRLATSVPRVRRAISAMGIEPLSTPRGDRLTDNDLERLANRLGTLPAGWSRSREDGFVLAALNRRPLGLRSKRAVARAAHISPTCAGRVIERLIDDGLVRVERLRTIEGRATDVDIFVIARSSPGWNAIVRRVRSIRLPQDGRGDHRPAVVPHRLWHHFWNADPAHLELPRDANYVAGRLLRSRDPQAIAWAATHLDAESILRAAQLRGLDAADQNLFQHLAARAAS